MSSGKKLKLNGRLASWKIKVSLQQTKQPLYLHHIISNGASMNVKFLVELPAELRGKIKREAKKHGISMNEYIVTVLREFVALQGNKNGNDAKGESR